MIIKNPTRRRGNLSSLPKIELNHQPELDRINIHEALGGRRFGIFTLQNECLGKLREIVESPRG